MHTTTIRLSINSTYYAFTLFHLGNMRSFVMIVLHFAGLAYFILQNSSSYENRTGFIHARHFTTTSFAASISRAFRTLLQCSLTRAASHGLQIYDFPFRPKQTSCNTCLHFQHSFICSNDNAHMVKTHYPIHRHVYFLKNLTLFYFALQYTSGV